MKSLFQPFLNTIRKAIGECHDNSIRIKKLVELLKMK